MHSFLAHPGPSSVIKFCYITLLNLSNVTMHAKCHSQWSKKTRFRQTPLRMINDICLKKRQHLRSCNVLPHKFSVNCKKTKWKFFYHKSVPVERSRLSVNQNEFASFRHRLNCLPRIDEKLHHLTVTIKRIIFHVPQLADNP